MFSRETVIKCDKPLDLCKPDDQVCVPMTALICAIIFSALFFRTLIAIFGRFEYRLGAILGLLCLPFLYGMAAGLGTMAGWESGSYRPTERDWETVETIRDSLEMPRARDRATGTGLTL